MSEYDKIERPLSRMAYRHIKGETFVIWGVCDDFDGKETPIVLMASLSNGKPLYFPLNKFWDKHPQTGDPRFELVIPATK